MQPQMPSGAREFASAAADSAGCGGWPAALRSPALPDRAFLQCPALQFRARSEGAWPGPGPSGARPKATEGAAAWSESERAGSLTDYGTHQLCTTDGATHLHISQAFPA